MGKRLEFCRRLTNGRRWRGWDVRVQPGRRKRLYGLGLVGLGVGNIVLIFILLAFFRRLVRPLRRPRAHPCTLGRPRLVCTRNSNRGIRPHGRRTPPPRVETHKTSRGWNVPAETKEDRRARV